MLEELKTLKEVVEAVKIAESNMNLEKDMADLEIDKDIIQKKLIKDKDIQNKAIEKVKKKNE